MAAMEETEADNMDQNLGMENQDLSRGNIFLYFRYSLILNTRSWSRRQRRFGKRSRNGR